MQYVAAHYAGNVEAIYRTQCGVEDADKVLTAAGKPALEYFDANAAQKWQTDLEGAWSAKAAKDYMDTNLVTYNEVNNMIEQVICNNDGMAVAIAQTVKAISEGKTPAEALASLTDNRFSVASDCASKLYVAYAPYTGE